MSKLITLSKLKTALTPLIALINKKAERPNWNENNRESVSYIENRPFYTEEKEIVLCDGTFELYNDYYNEYYTEILTKIKLVKGQTYEIIYNGVTYTIKCTYNANWDEYDLEWFDQDNYYYCIYQYQEGSYVYTGLWMYNESETILTSCDLTVTTIGENIVKIPSEYLPEMIGQKGSGEGAEIFNLYKNISGYGEVLPKNSANGDYSHAEGYSTSANGNYSHTEGTETAAIGESSHAEGNYTFAYGNNSHTEGGSSPYPNTGYYSNMSLSDNQLISNTSADVSNWFSPGNIIVIPDTNLKRIVKEVGTNYCILDAAFDEPYTYASNIEVEVIRQVTIAGGEFAHAEGYQSVALGDCSHAEGESTLASGMGSHAEGVYSQALGNHSHAEGSGWAHGNCSHAEGNGHAKGNYSHAEGYNTEAENDCAHAEGDRSKAIGEASHAEGIYTIANGEGQHTQGQCNIEDTENKYAHIVGNGVYNARSNAHTLDWNGNAWFAGDVYVGSTSGKNKDDGSKKLVTEESVASIVTTKVEPLESYISSPRKGIPMLDEVNGYTYILTMRNGELVTYIGTDHIEVTQVPNKMTYMEGEYLDTEGMVVLSYGIDGTYREITNYECLEPVTNGKFKISYNEYGTIYNCYIEVSVEKFNPSAVLIDFEYTDNGNGTYTITAWKGTYNGETSTEIIIPNNSKIIV